MLLTFDMTDSDSSFAEIVLCVYTVLLYVHLKQLLAGQICNKLWVNCALFDKSMKCGT